MKVNVVSIGVMSDNAHNERIYYNREGMIILNSKKAEHIIWELKFEMNKSNDGWTGPI